MENEEQIADAITDTDADASIDQAADAATPEIKKLIAQRDVAKARAREAETRAREIEAREAALAQRLKSMDGALDGVRASKMDSALAHVPKAMWLAARAVLAMSGLELVTAHTSEIHKTLADAGLIPTRNGPQGVPGTNLATKAEGEDPSTPTEIDLRRAAVREKSKAMATGTDNYTPPRVPTRRIVLMSPDHAMELGRKAAESIVPAYAPNSVRQGAA